MAACTPHAPIAACTAARLTPSRDSLRHHSYWSATVSTSILPACNSAAPQQPAVPKPPTPVSSRQWDFRLVSFMCICNLLTMQVMQLVN
nr:hypothetical protein Iba_chr15dCG7720 [Ipomoea batatas]